MCLSPIHNVIVLLPRPNFKGVKLLSKFIWLLVSPLCRVMYMKLILLRELWLSSCPFDNHVVQRGLTFVSAQEQPVRSERIIGVVKVQLSVWCAFTFYFIYFNKPDYIVFQGMCECDELICQAGILEALSPTYPRGLNPGLFNVPVIKIKAWELSEWAVIHSHTALLGCVHSYLLPLRELHKQVGDSQGASMTEPEKLCFSLSHSRLFYSLFIYLPSLVVPVAQWPGVPALGPSELPCLNSHIWKAPWASSQLWVSPLRRVASLIGPEEIGGRPCQVTHPKGVRAGALVYHAGW